MKYMEEELAWRDSEGKTRIMPKNIEWTPELAGHMEEELAWFDSEGIMRKNSEWTPELAGHMEEELGYVNWNGKFISDEMIRNG